MLPEGWKEIPLHEAANYRRGSFPQPYGLAKWFDKDNGFPFVQVFDISDSLTLKPTTKTTISRLAAEQSVFAPKGSVLVSLQGSIGRVAISQYDAYVDRTVLIITGYKQPVDNLFFALVLEVLFAKEKELAPGGTIKTITKSTLNNFTIYLPPLPEQKKIAAILSTWDRAIEGTEKLLANSQQQKKALMQQLLTGKKRLPGFTGERFHLPFKKVAELIYGKALPEKLPAHTTVYPVYGTGGIISYSGEYLFEGPSIIIGRKGTIDTPRYVNTPFWCIDTTFYCKSIHNNDVKFLYYSICFVKLRRYVEASGVPSLSRDTIYSIPLPLPPSLPEQQAIAAVLTTADEEIAAIESDLSRLRQEKKALMQQLLTGKRRVTVD
ncbi:restriction endonuclease subunit S [Acetobacter pasteurianus]|uniref:restriction endonuclease subunit S n=1 Tax=Acetobacter pasteurianus TaxID=438 RepID=UPI000F58E3B5|nr:restriction endonuclease subunit S [Acetobacter pasteurianus]GCD56713.1 restriction endonuclease subunit S [Acetobacter pasteurianus NBRC 3222]